MLNLTIYNNGSFHYISNDDVQNGRLIDELRTTYQDYRCPLLSNINFNYPNGSVDQLTVSSFPYFFKGQELVVSGRILSGEDDYIRMSITGVIGNGRTITWRRIISARLASQREEGCLIDKMSAYMRVKQSYTKYLYNPTEELKNEIIKQSKLNHFVTNPLLFWYLRTEKNLVHVLMNVSVILIVLYLKHCLVVITWLGII